MEKNVDITATEYNLDEFIKPPIYSRKAIWGFSIFFSPFFSGVLLMQNLKDIQKRKVGVVVFIFSFLWTLLSLLILSVIEFAGVLPQLLSNLTGGLILTQFFFAKYFPDESSYQKKSIWKPLFIGVLIVVAFSVIDYFFQDLELE